MGVAILGYDIAAKIVPPSKLIGRVDIGRHPILDYMLKTAVVGWWAEVVENCDNEG